MDFVGRCDSKKENEKSDFSMNENNRHECQRKAEIW